MRRMTTVGLAVLGMLVAACSAEEPVAVDTSSPSTTLAIVTSTEAPAATTTTLSDDEIEAALALGELYIDAHNSGYADEVMTLIAPNAGFGDSFGGSGTRTFWHERLVWNNAQGTQLTDAECSVIDTRRSEVRVACDHGTYDALSQAVDGPPVGTVTTLTISSGAIVDLFERYSNPDFNYVGGPFDQWLRENHPDVAASGSIGFGDWSNADEARENGLLIREYAALWATYLTENGCTYREGC